MARSAAVKRGLLALACLASLQATEPASDPFAPSGRSFAESLPPATRPPGREVVVHVLEVREKARATPWPDEPPPEWLTEGKESGHLSVKTRLNVDVGVEGQRWIEKDPAGKALAERFWWGSTFACRPDETDEPGVYSFNFHYTRSTLDGWVEEPKGTYVPLRRSRSIQTRLTLNNRWLRMGAGETFETVRAADGAKETAEASVLYLRIEDGLPPAAVPPRAQEPTFVTPAR